MPAARRPALRCRLLVSTLEQRLVRATFMVTNLADAGPGSLRQAVLDANASADPMDVVDATGVSGTIKVASVIDITGPTDIRGPGADKLTVSGEGQSRLIGVYQHNFGDAFNISGLTLTKGIGQNADGPSSMLPAIFIGSAAATMRNCVVSDNLAGDPFLGEGAMKVSGGRFTVEDCVFDRNIGGTNGIGGALLMWGVLDVTIRRTTFQNNVSYSGGAIGLTGFEARNNQIEDCTFLDNKGDLGAAIYSFSWADDVTIIRNSTFSRNTGQKNAIYAGSFGAGQVDVANCTIINNGNPVDQDSTRGLEIINSKLTLTSCIIANNAGGDVYAANGSVAAVVTANNNLIGIYDTSNVSLSGTGNLTGTLSSPLDPLLAPLADNGGPTLTHALLPGSPAIDAGSNPGGLTTDQRGEGFARQIGSAPDIGAFEYNPTPAPTAAITVGNGAPQRSMVRGLTIQFDTAVSFPSGLATAFSLNRTGPGGPTGSVPLGFTQAGNIVTIIFNDPTFAPVGGSLIDGNYSLTLNATKIVGAGGPLDGNANGIPGDNQTLTFHRLFGNADGDADVDTSDFAALRSAFGGPSTTFDFDNDGDVDTADLGQFRGRFGMTL